MDSEKYTAYRKNKVTGEIVEMLPKTVSSQVYDSDNEQFLDETLTTINTHTKDESAKKHIEVVSNVPIDLAETGILFKVDGSQSDVPGMVTVDTLKENVLAVAEQLEEKVNRNDNIVYIDDYIQYKNGNNWIPSFVQAFTDLTNNGGGICQLSAETYVIDSTLIIPSNVQVIGVGIGVSIIRLSNGKDVDIVSLDTNKNCGISSLTIYGNRTGANPSNNKAGLVFGRAGLSSELNNGTMPNTNVHDLEITQVSGDGLRCYANTWVYMISRFYIRDCTRYGAWIDSTDNMFDSFYISNNGAIGLYITRHNNRFSNMKIIFNGKSNNTTDILMAGLYSTGIRNTYINIECQENYGHGFVFDGAKDSDLYGLLSDANGYGMIAKGLTEPTAVGFYFNNCQRLNGSIKATQFGAKNSQKRGYHITSNCIDNSLDYENDVKQPDLNYSTSSIVLTSKRKINLLGTIDYQNFLSSGLTLVNRISGYNATNFNFSIAGQLTSYSVNGTEIEAVPNWENTSGRLATNNIIIEKDHMYAVRLKLKGSVANYFLRVSCLYNEAPYTNVQSAEGRFSSTEYTTIYLFFVADRDSTRFITYISDKDSRNAAQHPFFVKDVAIVDVTEMESKGYMTAFTLDKILEEEYFVGTEIFNR